MKKRGFYPWKCEEHRVCRTRMVIYCKEIEKPFNEIVREKNASLVG